MLIRFAINSATPHDFLHGQISAEYLDSEEAAKTNNCLARYRDSIEFNTYLGKKARAYASDWAMKIVAEPSFKEFTNKFKLAVTEYSKECFEDGREPSLNTDYGPCHKLKGLLKANNLLDLGCRLPIKTNVQIDWSDRPAIDQK